MSSYKRNYSNFKSYNKPKTVGFEDSEAEEDTDIETDSEPGDQEYFEYLNDKLDTISNKLDTLLEKCLRKDKIKAELLQKQQ